MNIQNDLKKTALTELAVKLADINIATIEQDSALLSALEVVSKTNNAAYENIAATFASNLFEASHATSIKQWAANGCSGDLDLNVDRTPGKVNSDLVKLGLTEEVKTPELPPQPNFPQPAPVKA